MAFYVSLEEPRHAKNLGIWEGKWGLLRTLRQKAILSFCGYQGAVPVSSTRMWSLKE